MKAHTTSCRNSYDVQGLVYYQALFRYFVWTSKALMMYIDKTALADFQSIYAALNMEHRGLIFHPNSKLKCRSFRFDTLPLKPRTSPLCSLLMLQRFWIVRHTVSVLVFKQNLRPVQPFNCFLWLQQTNVIQHNGELTFRGFLTSSFCASSSVMTIFSAVPSRLPPRILVHTSSPSWIGWLFLSVTGRRHLGRC